MRLTPTLALVLLFVAAPAASAAPTLIAPTPASLADSRPLLSWTAPPGEVANVIEVSKKPDVTPEGEFFNENYASGGVPAAGTTSWQPTSRLGAGTYWWNISWYASDYSASGYTPASSFTIPLQVKANGASITQFTYSADMVRVAYTTNTPRVDVTCLVYHGRRRIARGTAFTTYNSIGVRSSSTCMSVNVGRAYGGKRLRLVGEVRAGGKLSRATSYFTGKRG